MFLGGDALLSGKLLLHGLLLGKLLLGGRVSLKMADRVALCGRIFATIRYTRSSGY